MTNSKPADPRFADAFPAASEAQWRGLVEKVLKGAPFERLIGKSADGIEIAPLYQGQPTAGSRALKASSGPWRVLTRIDHPDALTANAAALTDLENGATGLQLVLADAPSAHGFGLRDGSAETLADALEGVFLDAGVRLELDAGARAIDAATALARVVEARKFEPALTDIGFGLDPLGAAAFSGNIEPDWPRSAALAKDLAGRGFSGQVFAADGRIVHAAGGTEAQELAFTIASGVAGLRALESAGVDLDAARKMIGFRLAADADEFLTLAKFRALRRLWARIEESCGLASSPVHLHAETAWRMTSRRDPWVNMLRATVATFSAGLGGADSICVTPFTQALGLPDDFARRTARNTQLVLIEESNLGKVADPAAGAGGFEALTEDLCDRAWGGFQAIEKAGGLQVALASGSFQTSVLEARAARARKIASRREALTGVSEFPNVHEASVAVLDAIPASTPAPASTASPRLSPCRDAEPFEALRDRADALKAAGNRPSIFLANLGPISAFSARAGFAKNFFEAGGIEALSNDGFESPAKAAEAFAESGAPLVCICSSDQVYAELAVEAARALAAGGAKRIYLAGRPGELEAALRAAGVAEFIFVGVDVLSVLQNAFNFVA